MTQKLIAEEGQAWWLGMCWGIPELEKYKRLNEISVNFSSESSTLCSKAHLEDDPADAWGSARSGFYPGTRAGASASLAGSQLLLRPFFGTSAASPAFGRGAGGASRSDSQMSFPCSPGIPNLRCRRAYIAKGKARLFLPHEEAPRQLRGQGVAHSWKRPNHNLSTV